MLLIAEQAGDIERTLDRLDRLIRLSGSERARVLREVRKRRRFVPVTVREGLDWREVAKIEVNAPELPGVSIDVDLVRDYPHSGQVGPCAGLCRGGFGAGARRRPPARTARLPRGQGGDRKDPRPGAPRQGGRQPGRSQRDGTGDPRGRPGGGRGGKRCPTDDRHGDASLRAGPARASPMRLGGTDGRGDGRNPRHGLDPGLRTEPVRHGAARRRRGARWSRTR